MTKSHETTRVRVGAVDDQPVILCGLGTGLQNADPGLRLVKTASTVGDLLSDQPRLDVVLLDVSLRDGSAPDDNVRRLCQAGCHVLVYMAEDNVGPLPRAVRAGALGAVFKESELGLVAAAVRTVSRGEVAVSQTVATALQRCERLRIYQRQ